MASSDECPQRVHGVAVGENVFEVADVPAYDIPFDPTEYDDRLIRLRTEMEERGLQGVVLTEPADIYYLSGYDTQGFWAYQALVVPFDGPLTLVCFVEEVGHAEARGLEHVGYSFGGDHVAATVATIERAGLAHARLGVDQGGRYLPAAVLREIGAGLPNASIVDISDLMEGLRLVKSPAEIAYIREASVISNDVMGTAVEAMSIGVSDRSIAMILTSGSIAQGSDYFAMGPYVRFGPTMVEGHLTWQGRRFEKGDVAELEVAAVRRRYNAPVLRYVVAEPTEPHLEVASEASRLGIQAAVAATAPGVLGSEVQAAAYEAGFEYVTQHGVAGTYLPDGYSVGIGYPPDWTEADVIAASSEYVLEPNMVFHMVSLFLFPQARIGTSELVIVTDEGCEALNTLDPGPVVVD